MITLFRDLKQTDKPFYLPVEKVLDRIKNGSSKELCEKIRQYEGPDNKAKRNELKKMLPAICFSGKFINRSKQGIVEHSGLICIDFDGFIDEWSMLDYRAFLIHDEYSYAVFTSPSGDGLKVLVKIPPSIDNHVNFFLSLKSYYNVPEFDSTTKDISRVCFESYDPELFINENSAMWEDLSEEEHVVYDSKTSRSTIRLTNHDEIVRRLLVWWERDFGMALGQKNNNLFVLAAALNDFGVSESDARSVLLSYDEGGKEREIVNILRSAYKNTAAHGTKFYEDNSKTDSIRTMAKQGVPMGEIMSRNASVSQDVIKSITKETNDNDVTIFWSKNSRGNVIHINHLYKEYLEYMGYGKYYVEGGNTFVFVQVKNNIISDAYDYTIKDTVLNDYLYGLEDKSIYNYFADKKGLFKEDHLSFLNTIKPMIMTDTHNIAYLYYRNCMVKVTSDGIELVDYSDIDGYIWEKQIIDRDFVKSDYDDCVYKRFINNVGGGEPDRIASIESTAGYLMHSYKPPEYAPAVIINDEIISDNPEGGTGKGIFVKSLSYLKKAVAIDGKSFTFNKSFPYQTVSADTQLLVFDDVSRYFEFEKLFSIITEGITLEKKNKDAIKLPFERSPKIMITTNYAIKGAGNSFDRRKWELEFAQYYTKNFTPKHEFGHQLFAQWDSVEWAKFDNYMIANLQMYLQKGLRESQFKNLKERKFIAETSMDFYEWCKDRFNVMTKNGAETLGIELHRSFVLQNPDYSERGKYCIPLARFYRWIDLWGEFQFNQRPVTFRSSNGKMIRFEMKPDEQGEFNF